MSMDNNLSLVRNQKDYTYMFTHEPLQTLNHTAKMVLEECIALKLLT